MKSIARKILTASSVFALVTAFVGVLAVATPDVTHAQNCSTSGQLTINSGVDCARGSDQPKDLFGGNDSMFKKVTSVMLFLVGAVSVIMLIIGGIRYVVSGGDQSAVQGAKNTILYAIVGIIVAILAYAIVSFVTKQFSDNNGGF